MCGSIHGFQENVDLMFCTEILNGRERLDIAAVIRRSTTLPSCPPNPSFLKPPLGALCGGGASVGPFYVGFFAPQRVLVINGISLLTLEGDQNVALLAEESGRLVLKGVDSVNSDLGPSSLDVTTSKETRALVRRRMREILLEAPKVKHFIQS
jgi:hypothetical protein